jgi:hypothetical protein
MKIKDRKSREKARKKENQSKFHHYQFESNSPLLSSEPASDEVLFFC